MPQGIIILFYVKLEDFLSVSYSRQRYLQKEQDIILFSNQEIIVKIIIIILLSKVSSLLRYVP